MKEIKYTHLTGSPLTYEGQNTIILRSDAETHHAALDDPDALPLTEKQLKKFKPVNPFAKTS